MDNIQLILYIIFLVGYFLFKLVTGKNKPVTRQNPEKFDQDKDKEREHESMEVPKTFEEILEELTGGRKRPAKESEPQKKVEETSERVFDYDEKDKSFYENTVKETSKYSTLDEQIDLSKLDVNVGEVEEIEEPYNKKGVSNAYLAMFDNLEEAKKAVIMSEIINRKY